jgi:hypothetical protein
MPLAVLGNLNRADYPGPVDLGVVFLAVDVEGETQARITFNPPRFHFQCSRLTRRNSKSLACFHPKPRPCANASVREDDQVVVQFPLPYLLAVSPKGCQPIRTVLALLRRRNQAEFSVDACEPKSGKPCAGLQNAIAARFHEVKRNCNHGIPLNRCICQTTQENANGGHFNLPSMPFVDIHHDSSGDSVDDRLVWFNTLWM